MNVVGRTTPLTRTTSAAVNPAPVTVSVIGGDAGLSTGTKVGVVPAIAGPVTIRETFAKPPPGRGFSIRMGRIVVLSSKFWGMTTPSCVGVTVTASGNPAAADTAVPGTKFDPVMKTVWLGPPAETDGGVIAVGF